MKIFEDGIIYIHNIVHLGKENDPDTGEDFILMKAAIEFTIYSNPALLNYYQAGGGMYLTFFTLL